MDQHGENKQCEGENSLPSPPANIGNDLSKRLVPIPGDGSGFQNFETSQHNSKQG